MFRLLLLCVGLNKLASTQALFLMYSNILVAVFASFKIPLRVYLNKNIQDIIEAVIETKPAIAKSLRERFFKAYFSDIYRGDNYMACYNFCQ